MSNANFIVQNGISVGGPSGATISADPTTGAVVISAAPTASQPNPVALVFNNAGAIGTVATSGGVANVAAVSTAANTASGTTGGNVSGNLSLYSITGLVGAGNLNITGNIIPTANITYDLGSKTNQWHSAYIGPGTLYINGTPVLSASTTGTPTINFSASSGQNMSMQTIGGGILQLSGNTDGGGANTFIGREAGLSVTTGSYNTFVGAWNSSGAGSGSAVTTGSKNTILGGYSGNQGGLDIRTASNYIVLSDGDGNPRGVFDSSGNLIVGGTSISDTGDRLCINQGDAAGNRCGFSGGGSSNLTSFNINCTTGSNYLYFRFGGKTATYNKFEFDDSGNAYKSSGAGSWLALSDIRIKENIQPVVGGLDRIMLLNPVTFDYKRPEAHNNKKHDKGFIADEFMLVYPDSVSESALVGDADREFIPDEEKAKALGFNAEFYADLVASIQSLKFELDSVKAELATLKGN